MIKENEEEHNFNKILKCVKCENYLEETIINENEVLFLCSNKYVISFLFSVRIL